MKVDQQMDINVILVLKNLIILVLVTIVTIIVKIVDILGTLIH